MKSAVMRLLPALAVAALLLFAAFAGGARPGSAAPAAADWISCAAGQLDGTDALYNITYGTGVRQPFDGTVPVAACSLGLDNSYVYSQFQVQFWDPLTLAPGAGEIALRSIGYNTSQMLVNHLRADFSPPLVTQSVDGVAEPGRTSLALDYQVLSSYSSQSVHYWSAGHDDLPAALAYTSAGSTPLPGSHPVLGTGFCAWPDYAGLRVVQSVVKQDLLIGFAPHDYVQRFRVPQRCEVSHVELAFGYNANANVQLGHLAIIDAAGTADPPPAGYPVAMADADFYHYVTVAGWDTHYDFGRTIVLEANHDYWLWVYTGYAYTLYAKHRTGGESIAFANDIAGMYTRTGPFTDWTPWPGYALDFRIVGTPVSAVSVAPPSPSPARGLHVSVAPNPVSGATTLTWSGAREGARLEVLDPRGRRVAVYEGAGASGAWLWRGVADSGRPLPAGIYFVRATDRGGSAGTARLVLVR
jgi:hypothetical protein